MKKTVTIEGVDYTLATMTAGDGLDIQEEVAESDATDKVAAMRRTFRVVAASLRITVEDAKSSVPWTHYIELIDPALEVNGMKVAEAAGEPQAGASPVA